MKHLLSDKYRFWLGLLLPIVIVIIIYTPLYRQGPFISDDSTFLSQWALLRDPSRYGELLKGALPEGHQGGYRPLRTVYEGYSLQLFGQNAVLYHIQGVAIHVIAIILVFFVLLKLLDLFEIKKHQLLFVSIGTCIFAVHPAIQEAVAFIQATFDTIGIILGLLSYHLFLSIFSERTNKYKYLFLSTFFALVAFCFYELLYPLPILFVITGFLLTSRKQLTRKTLSASLGMPLPSFLTLGGILFLRSVILQLPLSRATLSPGSWYNFLATTRAIYLYFFQTIFPKNLSLQHDIAFGITNIRSSAAAFQLLKITDYQTIIALVVTGGLLVLAYAWYKKNPLFSLGVCWYFLGLTPVLNILFHTAIYAERYLYFSMIGFVCIVLSMLPYVFDTHITSEFRKKIFLTMVILVLSLYTLRTFLRVQDWTNPIVFWKKEIEQLPYLGILYGSLGVSYLNEGKTQEAIDAFKVDIAMQQNDAFSYHNLALTLYNLGRYDEASKYSEQAVLLKPNDNNYFANLQKIFIARNKPLEDLDFYQIFLKKVPNNPVIYYAYGTSAMQAGQTATAEASLRKSLELNPGIIQTYNNLGILLIDLNKPKEAKDILEKGVMINNNAIQEFKLLYHLAVAYKMLNEFELAKKTATEAYNIDKSNPQIIQLIRDLDSKK